MHREQLSATPQAFDELPRMGDAIKAEIHADPRAIGLKASTVGGSRYIRLLRRRQGKMKRVVLVSNRLLDP